MSHVPGTDEVQRLVRAQDVWWTKRDPLLGAEATSTPEDGRLVRHGDALGCWNTTTVSRDETYSLWVAEVTQKFSMLFPKPPTTETIDALLSSWLAASNPSGVELLVSLPAMLAEATVPLASRGFVPLATTAVRRVQDTPDPIVPASLAVGPPEVSERDVLLDLLVELHDEELAYGSSRPHPRARDHYGSYLDAALNQPDWTWVARKDGQPVGLVSLSPPEESQWVAPLTSIAPVAYLGFAITTASARGLGAGPALVAHAMRQAQRSGCQAVVLDHAALSPISSTFWHRRGFRPLWTRWARLATQAPGSGPSDSC